MSYRSREGGRKAAIRHDAGKKEMEELEEAQRQRNKRNTTIEETFVIDCKLPRNFIALLGVKELLYALVLRMYVAHTNGGSDKDELITQWKNKCRSIVVCIRHTIGDIVASLKNAIRTSHELTQISNQCLPNALVLSRQIRATLIGGQ